MTRLRRLLGIGAVLTGGGYALLLLMGSQFRRSFGASPIGLLTALIPIIAAALLTSSVIWPTHRPLQFITALAVTALIGACLWFMIRESATVLAVPMAHSTLWLVSFFLNSSPGKDWSTSSPHSSSFSQSQYQS